MRKKFSVTFLQLFFITAAHLVYRSRHLSRIQHFLGHVIINNVTFWRTKLLESSVEQVRVLWLICIKTGLARCCYKHPVSRGWNSFWLCWSSRHTVSEFLISWQRGHTSRVCALPCFPVQQWKRKLSPCFKLAPRHEGVLGEWIYSAKHSWPRH
jgi:hypothetical protein